MNLPRPFLLLDCANAWNQFLLGSVDKIEKIATAIENIMYICMGGIRCPISAKPMEY